MQGVEPQMNKVGLIAGIITTIMLSYLAYSSTVRLMEANEALEEAKIHDAKLEAYGCYTNPNNDEQYLCPNGLPSGVTE
jgi:hypothetical protein